MAKCKFEYDASWSSGQEKEVKIEFDPDGSSARDINVIFVEFDNFLRGIGFSEDLIQERHEAHYKER